MFHPVCASPAAAEPAGGAFTLPPELWERFASLVPERERAGFLHALLDHELCRLERRRQIEERLADPVAVADTAASAAGLEAQEWLAYDSSMLPEAVLTLEGFQENSDAALWFASEEEALIAESLAIHERTLLERARR